MLSRLPTYPSTTSCSFPVTACPPIHVSSPSLTNELMFSLFLSGSGLPGTTVVLLLLTQPVLKSQVHQASSEASGCLRPAPPLGLPEEMKNFTACLATDCALSHGIFWTLLKVTAFLHIVTNKHSCQLHFAMRYRIVAFIYFL